MLLANFAILATALFTGAAVYISLVEHPARLQRCPQRYARQIESFIAAPMLGAMASRRRAVRAARRRAKRTLENAARRERAAEAAEDDRPRVARHVDQLDHLLTEGAITADMAKAGNRFARDFERSATVIGRLGGRNLRLEAARWPARPCS
jgi:hypothetical protein